MTDADTADFQTGVPIDQPKQHYWQYGWQTEEERKKYNVGQIFVNAAICHLCEDFIRSNNKHDFKYCSCGNVAVDGGSWYAKRNFKTTNFTDVIVTYDDIKTEGKDDDKDKE